MLVGSYLTKAFEQFLIRQLSITLGLLDYEQLFSFIYLSSLWVTVILRLYYATHTFHRVSSEILRSGFRIGFYLRYCCFLEMLSSALLETI